MTERRIDGRAITVGEHFALEAHTLRPLPAEPFDTSAAADATGSTPSRGSVSASASTRCRSATSGAASTSGSAPTPSRSSTAARSVAAMPGPSPRAARSWCWTTTSRCCACKPGALPGATALARARASGAFGADARTVLDRRPAAGSATGPAPAPSIEVLLAHRMLPADAVRIAGIAAGARRRRRRPRGRDRRSPPGRRRTAAPSVVPIGDGLARYDRPPPTIGHYDQLLEAAR